MSENQATANLSIGIKTDKAKVDLANLKKWLASEMKAIAIDIDPKALEQSIKTSLGNKRFKVTIDTKDLANEVSNDVSSKLQKTLNDVFSTKRDVGYNHDKLVGGIKAALDGNFGRRDRALEFDRNRLTTDIDNILARAFSVRHNVEINTEHLREQIALALGGITLSLGASGHAAPSAGLDGAALARQIAPELGNVIHSALTPAVDELVKAASVIAGTARQAGAGGGAKRGDPSGSISQSARMADGTTVRVGMPIDAKTGALAIDDANRVNQGAKTEAEARRDALKRDRALELIDRRETAARASEMEAMWGARDAADASARERGVTEMLKSQIRERTQAQREGLESFRNFAAAEKKIQDDLNAALAAAEKARKANVAPRSAVHGPDSAQLVSWKADAQAPTSAVYGPSPGQLRAWKSALDDVNLAPRSAVHGPDSAQLVAWAADAQAPRSAVMGPDPARLKAWKAAAEEADAAQRKAAQSGKLFAGVMGEMHDGARGLAGSMGALWLTWGSVVPLAAGAAVGAAFREVLTSGKAVEYQLRFVSELSGGAALGMTELAAATKGAMTGPVEAAQALRGLAQNGLSATEALSALPAILNLATAGEMSLTEASLGATGVMAAFNLQVSDLGHIGDVFAKAAAMSNTSVGGMVEAMKQASQVGDQYHISLEDTAAALSVLAKRNIEGTAAGTAFRNMISELATPSKKAQAALKEMHIELFDANKQLVSFPEMLGRLKNATDGLNEKGKLNFLKDVFDERGAKAVNALLADSDLLASTMKELKTNADGFTQSLVQGLEQTAEGKLKQLGAEFASAGAKAFEATPSIKNFLDELRGVVNSDDVSQGMKSVTDGFVGSARVLVEHPILLAAVAAGWKGLSMAITAYRAEALTAAALTATLETGIAGLGAAMLGPLGLVIALGVAFVTLAHHTTDAEEAFDQYANRVRESNKAMDDQIARLERQNQLIEKQNELMLEGKTAEDARRIAEGSVESVDEREKRKSVGGLQTQNTADKARIGELEAQLMTPHIQNQAGEARDLAAYSQIQSLKDRIAANDKKIADLENGAGGLKELAAKRVTLANDTYRGSQDSETKSLIDWFQKYNATAANLEAKTGKDHRHLTTVDMKSLTGMSVEDLKALKDDLDGEKNSKLGGYTPVSNDHGADHLQQAKTRAVIGDLNSQEAAIKAQIKAQRELDNARFDTASYGPYMHALISEQNSIDDATKLLDFERKAVATLTIEKAKAAKAPEKVAIQAEIDKRSANIDLMVKELDTRQQVDAFTAQAHARAADRANAKYDGEQLASSNQRISAIDNSYRVKVIDPVEAARARAELAAMQASSKGIADEQEKVDGYIQMQVDLIASIATASDADKQSLMDRLVVLDSQLSHEQAILKARQDAAKLAAKKEGDHAAAGESYSESLSGGMEAFWTKFQNSATNTGKIVSDTMDSAYKTMEQGLDTFVTTGKMNFKSFAGSIMSDVARMMANQALRQLLSLGVNFVMGMMTSSGGTTTDGGVNGSAGTATIPSNLSANGNVMTADGPLALRKYANGGIARTPQLSVFGEGRLPEAYVPLPDGRSIPVTMQGGGDSGGGTSVNISINVDSNGKSQVESDTSGSQASKLATMMEDAVMTIIAREKRSGGILSTTS